MKIQEIYNKVLSETFNMNDLGWDNSKEFLQKLHAVKSNTDYEEVIINPVQELKTAVIENDDEVDLEFDDGKFIRLDINIIKYLLANFSDEELVSAMESYDNLTYFLEELYDVIELDTEVSDEIEDALDAE